MQRVSVQDQISGNIWRSFFLGFIVFMFILAFGALVGYLYDPALALGITFIALIISMAYTVFSYYYSDKIVLASVKAKPADPKKHKHLINVVEGLAIAGGIPKPRVYVMESQDINAFATGRDPKHGVVVVTSGMLELLNRSELEGVIAHELSHIKNYDIRFATLIAVMVGMIAIASDIFLRSLRFGGGDRESGKAAIIFIIIGLVLAILAPILTRLVQLAISRKREFLADASGAYMTRYPEGLASALEKISKQNKGMKVSGAVSHLFFADTTLKKVSSLFSTHPPIEERIRLLRQM